MASCISPIMDYFNREILSLCMDNNMRSGLCADTLKAVAGRFPIRGTVLYSDRGSQYTSTLFRQTLSSCGASQSLSGVDHCHDDVRVESFFATLKKELLYSDPGLSHDDGQGEVVRVSLRFRLLQPIPGLHGEQGWIVSSGLSSGQPRFSCLGLV